MNGSEPARLSLSLSPNMTTFMYLPLSYSTLHFASHSLQPKMTKFQVTNSIAQTSYHWCSLDHPAYLKKNWSMLWGPWSNDDMSLDSKRLLLSNLDYMPLKHNSEGENEKRKYKICEIILYQYMSSIEAP